MNEVDRRGPYNEQSRRLNPDILCEEVESDRTGTTMSEYHRHVVDDVDSLDCRLTTMTTMTIVQLQGLLPSNTHIAYVLTRAY